MAISVFVFGASGHGKVIIDILERMTDVGIAFAIDDAAGAQGRYLCGYRVLGGRGELPQNRARADTGIVAIGDNAARREVAAWLIAQGFKLASAIHPAAMLARGAVIGNGSAIMAGCVINSDAVLGNNVILNTGATIDHDCVISDCVHVAPGCHVCGGVTIGAGSLLGAGTTVVPGVRIGAHVVVGAGSTVLEDVPDGARVAGAPAKSLAATP